MPRKIRKSTNDAYLRSLPNQPTYDTVPVPTETRNAEERCKQLLEREEHSFSNWCENGNIPDVEDLKSEVGKRNVRPVANLVKDDYVSFIKL